MKYSMEQITNHLKDSGFFFPSSQIYGGLANSWDYGPLGVELKRNLKELWWNYFVSKNPLVVGLDSAIFMNPKIWTASGHLDNFSDPLIDCKKCKIRYRADHLIEEYDPQLDITNFKNKDLEKYICDKNIKCSNCQSGDFTGIRNFNLMFKTSNSITEESKNIIYLRPETAQGIFVNFKNIQRTQRLKLPFGVAQIGKSFRNEITPNNFIFRMKEFEQMEIEFFYNPNKKPNHLTNGLSWFDYWTKEVTCFLNLVGLNAKNYSLRSHSTDELAHYSSQTIDVEYQFPFGESELCGIADRGNFDLMRHQEYSGQDMSYLEPDEGKIIAHVIEPSVGVDRLILAILCDAFRIEKLESEERIVLQLNPKLCPYYAAVLPLSKKLAAGAYNLFRNINVNFKTYYDETGSIGKRYRRQDAIGTMFCITYDYQSEEDNKVTIRNRDTMSQDRIPISDIESYLKNHF